MRPPAPPDLVREPALVETPRADDIRAVLLQASVMIDFAFFQSSRTTRLSGGTCLVNGFKRSPVRSGVGP
jgi:hypothetical protein